MNRLLLILIAVLLLSGCDPETSGDNTENISGTVSSVENVKIGVFSSDYWFLDDYTSNDEDHVWEEFDGGVTGSYTPLILAEPDDDGSYSIETPEEVSQMGDLIAWIDSNGDGIFDLGTESGYLPVKNIDGTDYVVGFGYIDGGGETTILVSYGGSQNTDISIVGYKGYNFTLD